MMSLPALFAIAIVVLYLINSIKILKEYERAVVFRLGRVREAPRDPASSCLPPPRPDRSRLPPSGGHGSPPQDVITRDNVTLKVNAVITLRVVDPTKAVIEVANYIYQTSQFAQTTLRSVLGEVDLDGLLAHREAVEPTHPDHHRWPHRSLRRQSRLG